MGGLSLTRKEGEKLFLSVHPDADLAGLLRELTEHGITTVVSVGDGHARIKIEAPRGILVLREELIEEGR